jgi:hypothetical protein
VVSAACWGHGGRRIAIEPEGDQNQRINQIIEAFWNETPSFEADAQQDLFTFIGESVETCSSNES